MSKKPEETAAPEVKYATVGKNEFVFVRKPRYVDCAGCVRRGEKNPRKVKPGYQCDDCANIEEGAY